MKEFPLMLMWRKVSSNGILIFILDFILLALAVYLGYAIRLGLIIPRYIDDWLHVTISLPLVTVIIFALAGQYKTIWIHAGTEDYIKFIWLYIISVLIFLLANNIFKISVFPRTSFAISFFAGIILCGGLRFSWLVTKSIHAKSSRRLKTLIVGAGEAGAFLARDLMRNVSELMPCAFVDDDPQKLGRHVSGLDVIGNTENLRDIVKTKNFEVVLIAIPSANGTKIKEIYNALSNLNVNVRILPSLRELADGQVSVSRLRNVKLEDLLGREPVKINLAPESNYIAGKKILITGAGGSIGSEIVRQVLHNNPAEIYALGHGEQSIYLLMESLAKLKINIPVYPVIADVADEIAINNLFENKKPDVIFHAAAHKHVPLMEFSAREAMRVNDIGTRTLARAAGKFNCERMVLISTDKAVHPSSVMGATKRLAEKILENVQSEYPETKFMAVRFGNVLGSRGSVIPKFEEQIASGGPVTVTHPDMKRYFMLIPEAVSLVIQAGALGHGGEIFVLNMGEPVVIKEMAELLIKLCGYEPYKDIDIIYTGIRPGEKLEEALFYDENAVRGTLHPKIFESKIKANQIGNNKIPDINKTLERAVNNPNEALNLLRELVPEYK